MTIVDPSYLWSKGVQAGYDPEQNKWRLKGGQFCDREEALGERHPEAFFGAEVKFDIAPLSRKLDNLEMVIGGLDYNTLQASIKSERERADYMPVEIRAAMQLAEFYARTEGDLWATVVVPIQLALRDVEVQSNDRGVQDELREIYEHIDINNILLWNWQCTSLYGQAFPLEVWDENGKDLQGAVILNPKYMKVGKQISLTHSLYITRPESEEEWDEKAFEEQIHPMVYHSFASGWDEQAAVGNDIPLDPNRCHSLADYKLPFQRYAIPDVARCFRPLSTRQILEEMQRATIEGFRNQLWVFKVGTDEHPATPAEITYLRGLVGGMSGERTGILVWNHKLLVEQHAPATLDAMMGNEMWLALTLHIYRQRGLSLKLVTGESPQGGRASDMEWDTQVFMERLKFVRNQVMRWEKHIRKSIGEAKGRTWQKAKIEVQMVKPEMELQNLVEKHLRPLGQAGWLSIQTILEKAGYNYAVELERKKEEEPDNYLFLPKPTFSQSTQFNVPKEIQETPTGRPPGAEDQEPRTVEASMEFDAQDASFAGYVDRVFGLFNILVDAPARDAVDTFIDGMMDVNREEMLRFAADGYAVSGGAFQVDPQWINGAVQFVNGYAEGFRTDLFAAVDAGRDLDDLRWRVFLYPQEGRHLAYMWGLQQGMRERGARGWRRILHPELSDSGPCMICIDDSRIIHPISEGFWEPHPSGVCTVQSIAFYTAPTAIPTEVPIPKKYTIPEQIRELLERLGRIGKAIIRRVRGG